MFDIDLEENEFEQDNHIKESDEYINDFEDNDININLVGNEIDKDDNEYLNFDVFYKVVKNKKRMKTTYNEEFGNDNDLKKFWNNMKNNGGKLKEN